MTMLTTTNQEASNLNEVELESPLQEEDKNERGENTHA